MLIGTLTLVLLFVAMAAKTHDTAPVTDAVPTAEDTSASAADEVVHKKKKHSAGKAGKTKKTAAPVLVTDGSGEVVALSGQSSGGAGGTGGAAPEAPSRKVRVERDSDKGGGRERVELVPGPVTEEAPLPPEPQPQPQPEPQPQPAPQPPPPCNPNRCPPPGPD